MFKKVNLAILFLGISMLGIMSFQTYWLYESHQRETRLFRREMFRALSNSLYFEMDLRISKIIKELNSETLVIGRNYQPLKPHKLNESMAEIRSSFYEQFLSIAKIEDSSYQNIIKRPSDNDQRRREFDKMFLSVATRIYSADDLPAARYNTDELVKSFESELDVRNIGVKYKLAFLNDKDKVIQNLKGKMTPKEVESAIVINLRNNMPGTKIALFVPQEEMYIFSKNAVVSISSILMIIISILSMSFIISKFFSQKKIGEIRRDFMNNMTHELKTPISTVGLVLEAMANFDVLSNKEKTDRYIKIARQENQRLGLLVEKVLKMSAYERDNIQMKMENISADKVVEEVVKNLSFQVENKGGTINFVSRAKDSNINVDKVHYTNVIYNLVDNAIKYSDGIPEVDVVCYNQGNTYVVEVKDKGIGIPPAYRQKIFEKFFRVPSGNLHNVKGYGLGLSYVVNIMHKFGGKVEVESNSPKGSIFKLIINLS